LTAVIGQLVVTVDDYEVLNNVQDFINLHQLPVALGERVFDFVISSWFISRGIDADKVCDVDLDSTRIQVDALGHTSTPF